MKDEKKVNKAEEATTEENGVQLTDEQLEQVAAGTFTPNSYILTPN